jgi:uracil permease
LPSFLSFFPGCGRPHHTIPHGDHRGISLCFTADSAVGVRNIVENRVDFSKSRNLIIAAVILVTSLGFASIGGITVGGITLTAQALGALLGILLNAVLPGNDYVFDAPSKPAEAVTFKV